MAISTELRRAGPYTGDGAQTEFSFGFKVFEASQVSVVTSSEDGLTDVVVDPSSYSVTLNDNQDTSPGGTIRLTTALAAEKNLSILSAVHYVQPMVLTNRGGFYPEVLNDSADRAVILAQQNREILGRALTVPATSTETPAEMTGRLLEAADTATVVAKGYADAAKRSAEEAKKSEGQTKAYAEAATILVPVKDEIKTVADNIGDVTAVGQSIQSVNNVASVKTEVVEVAAVAGDVSIVAQKADAVATVADGMPHVEIVAKDLVGEVIGDGDYDCGSTTDSPIPDVEIVDGNIHTVATNIADVNKVADAIDRGDLETAVNAVETTTENVRLSQAAQKSAEAANASALEARAGADASNALAKKWATQTTAPVESDLYGAKYYAEKAAQSESSTGGLLQEVKAATAAGVRSVRSEGGTQVTAVQNAGSTAVNQITQEGSSQKSAVAAEGTRQVGLVASAGTSNVSKVNAAGTTQVAAVNAAGAAQTANAKAQADAAAKSATAASSAQKAAETAKAGADTASTTAKAWASKTGAAVDGGLYSALHYATYAETQAKKSETAAATATTKATEAGTKASEAATSAQAAAQSAKVAAFAVRLTSANMSANGTAALATLTPSTTVKVGDTVIDPEGEVFQIASLAASTFTVGARLANVRGPQGPKGETGAALAIKGSFPSLEELQEQHPAGTLGDAYMVGSRLYSWSGSAWVDCGDIKGPKGDQGTQGERGPTGPAGTTTWAGITGKPTLGALSAKDKITIADFEGDIDLGSTT